MTEPTYFDRVPQWPHLSSLSDEASGRVPVSRVESWRKFSEILEEPFFNRPKTQLVFRGHRRYDWPLSPSLGRLDARSIITKEAAEAQLRLFRRAVRGRLSDRSLVEINEEHELWAVGQHHGLMTPLLDWTYSPYVALFFAFEKEDRKAELDNSYRAIYVLNKTYVEQEDRCGDVELLEPRKDDHGRLVNQAGLFTFCTHGNTLENFLINSLHDEILQNIAEGDEARELANYICKIYVPNEDREGCLRHLRRMNVHHASLFPDLIGAAEYCNILVAEDSRQRAIEEAGQETIIGSLDAAMPPMTALIKGSVTLRITPSAKLEAVLKHPDESAQVEPGRLALIASEIQAEIERNKVVDWDKRESVKARLRNVVRSALRKYGYPQSVREGVVAKVLELATGEPDTAENVNTPDN